jgi:hypothetical protein
MVQRLNGKGSRVPGSPVNFASLHIFDIFNGASSVQRFTCEVQRFWDLGSEVHNNPTFEPLNREPLNLFH